MNREKLVKMIAVVNEATGGPDLSRDAILIYLESLEGYSDDEVTAALKRCAVEVKGRLALADIVSRIDDGWPEPDAAWALCPASEAETVVWTDEIVCSYYEASEQHPEDQVAVRMAFREIYRKKLVQARQERRRPEWRVSLGSDPRQREQAVRDGIRRGRIEDAMLHVYCPELARPKELDRAVAQIEGRHTPELPAHRVESSDDDDWPDDGIPHEDIAALIARVSRRTGLPESVLRSGERGGGIGAPEQPDDSWADDLARLMRRGGMLG